MTEEVEHVDYVINENGIPKTTSKLVALKFGRQHAHVLRTIKNLNCSAAFYRSNFGEIMIPRQLASGGMVNDVAYSMTWKGFTFLVTAFDGEKAGKFKEEFIEEFDRRGKELRQLRNEVLIQNAIRPFQEEIGQLNTQMSHANFKVASLNDFLSVNKRKINYVNTVLLSDGVYTTSELAAQLDMTAQALNKKLNELKVIYQEKDKKHWFLYAKYRGKGLQKSRTNIHTRLNAGYNSNTYMVWTEAGRAFIHNKINPLQPVKEKKDPRAELSQAS